MGLWPPLAEERTYNTCRSMEEMETGGGMTVVSLVCLSGICLLWTVKLEGAAATLLQRSK